MTEKLLAVKKKVLQNVLCWIRTRLVRSKFEAAMIANYLGCKYVT